MTPSRFRTLAISILATLAFALPIPAQADLVLTRQALMKEIGQTAFFIFRGMIDRTEGAEIIADNFADVATMFPEGSQGGHALPPVWSDHAGFLAILGRAQDGAEALLEAAEAGDDTIFMERLRALDEVCTECHRTYREPLDAAE